MSGLLPDAEAAVAAWRQMVVEERRQVERLPDRPRPEDFYGPIAESFKADPRRTDEPFLDVLRSLVSPDETWVDVGAGAGRYALPIALRARRVYAVEPSEGMRRALSEAAQEYGIDNVEVFDERWPCATAVPQADVSFISHVGYDIEHIGLFLDLMEAQARRLCVSVMFHPAPTAEFAPLWQAVHGEKRRLLPGAGEFVALLFARGRTPDVRFFDLPPRTYPDLKALHRAVHRPVWVREGSEQDERLRAAVEGTAVRLGESYVLSGRARRLALITWRSEA